MDMNAERIIVDVFYTERSRGKTLGLVLLNAKRGLALSYPEQKDALPGITIMDFSDDIASVAMDTNDYF